MDLEHCSTGFSFSRSSHIWPTIAGTSGMSYVIPTPPLCLIQVAFASLSHLWMNHRLSRNMKLRLCSMYVCTTLTHACEEWNLTKAVSRICNGLNSRCLYVRVITGEEYRDTGISRAHNMLLVVQQRRLRYLWHLLRLPRDSVVRRTLLALTDLHPKTRTAIRKGAYSWTTRVQNWKTLRPWQWTALHGGTKWRHLCFNVTLHDWTHWVHYEHDDDDG